MSDLVLYDDELDEDCYRARLALALCGLTARLHAIDVTMAREQDAPSFRALSPAGRLPALQGVTGTDDLPTICGAMAVLRAVAVLAGPASGWAPVDTGEAASVAHWLSFAEYELTEARRLRRLALFGPSSDDCETQTSTTARDALRIMEDHMTLRRISGGSWFVGDRPTIADIALFPSFALCRDYGLSHDDYPALRRWQTCVKGLPGFIAMPGVPEYG
ncbi:glutathione S-transferase family protein [Acetobacter sp. DsW_063]|uniref:glutathione S-transferase family protein n=1 Tax=Acetobacter sp. DsW_063 TaxID=1514894 RepID=UPI000A3D00C7|nr:glutathione S-transferase family protein [Acetobacter sp. DsW_063]OUJ16855.1 hypothetical protein HK28_10050 [Acetobacter sp. DsW_063]